jgi:hypothetical protein
MGAHRRASFVCAQLRVAHPSRILARKTRGRGIPFVCMHFRKCRGAKRAVQSRGDQLRAPAVASLISRRGMRSFLRNRSRAADTPRSRSCGSGQSQREKGWTRNGDICGPKNVNRRIRRRSDPGSQWNRGRSECNRVAHTDGRSGYLPRPPRASCAPWGCGGDRIAERIVARTSWIETPVLSSHFSSICVQRLR